MKGATIVGIIIIIIAIGAVMWAQLKPTPANAPTSTPTQKPVPTSEVQQNGGNVICTQQFQPVCGEDGKTYGNKCVAEQQAGVAVAHDGACTGSN